MIKPTASLEEMKEWARGIMSRAPDFVVGDDYLRRWWVVPRNDMCSVYLHEILHSDDDSAGHTHPWSNTSYLIDGEYIEVSYCKDKPWIEDRHQKRVAGDIIERGPDDCHRLILPEGGRAVSLFITGPKVKEWYFWCANTQSAIPWREFVDARDSGKIGRGCGE